VNGVVELSVTMPGLPVLLFGYNDAAEEVPAEAPAPNDQDDVNLQVETQYDCILNGWVQFGTEFLTCLGIFFK